MQTLINEPYPCATSPCIDSKFGPSQARYYWAATTYAKSSNGAWGVHLSNGYATYDFKPDGNYVRAVRGGL